MTARPIPKRHWRSYGDDPLPSAQEALDEPFRAFPSWFMRITCDRCGKDRTLSETYTPQRDMRIRDIIKLMRHAGCGGRASKVELITGIDGVSGRPVRRIVPRGAHPHGLGAQQTLTAKTGRVCLGLVARPAPDQCIQGCTFAQLDQATRAPGGRDAPAG